VGSRPAGGVCNLNKLSLLGYQMLQIAPSMVVKHALLLFAAAT
jgi:hypothetical protein